MKPVRPILIAAGGTGGHVFPALAVAEALRKKEVPVIWVGAHGIEQKVVPAHHFPLFLIHVSGLRGKGWRRALWMPFLLSFALLEAVFLILKHKPRLVLGMGGYVSGPVGIAAFLLRVPLVIQEQNAIAGFTNRWLAKIATRVLAGFPGAFPPNDKTFYTGNPIRQEIEQLFGKPKTITPPPKPFRLLILGGSLGAHALNQIVPVAMALLEPGVRPEIWHQTGAREIAAIQQVYQNSQIEAKTEAFIQDMTRAYLWADLVVCRAGAITIGELTQVGGGALLVPFPHAIDDHQTHNARYLSEAGAAILLPQSSLTPQTLADLLRQFHHNRSDLEQMGSASAKLARPHVTDEVVTRVLEF